MVIRIVHGGNPATRIIPSFDECVIESLVDERTGESDGKSFIKDLRDGSPVFKRIRSDEETEDYISDLYENEEIASVTQDENRDFIITLREMGEEPLDIGIIPDDCPE